MVVEGAATYFSQKITGESDRTAYWSDLLTDEQFATWRAFAKTEKPAFAKRIQNYLEDPRSEPKLMADLLFVLKMEDLEHKRTGYLYGAEAVRTYDQKKNRGLDFSYEDIQPELKRYWAR